MIAVSSEMISRFVPSPEAYDHPLVLSLAEMSEDELLRRRAERMIRGAGSAALGGQVTVERVRQETAPSGELTCLMDAIHRAAQGDQVALDLIGANVGTDMVERTMKAGVVMQSEIAQDQQGDLLQHGQTLESVHGNTLRFAAATPEMYVRAGAETRNYFRLKDTHRQGLLEEYYFVVFSRCEANMSKQALIDAGFFPDTMSCAIQATCAADGGLAMESAFVAGAIRPEAERHDEQTIVELGAALSVDYSGKSPAEIIDMPLLIHKSLMPNGVIDLVKLYDQQAGGRFFGEAKPQRDYLEYVELCKQRQAVMTPTARLIAKQLIAEADNITTPQAAVQRLHKLSEQYMVEHSVVDKTINPQVFGSEAAGYIEQARLHSQMGNQDLAVAALGRAQQTAKSSSCPSALKQAIGTGEAADEAAASETTESKDGKIKCIKCDEQVDKKDVVKAKSWCCPKCKYEVDICNGREINPSQPPERGNNVIPLFARKEKKQSVERRQVA